MLSFHRVVEDDFLAVNSLIVKELHSNVELVENIGQYIIDAGGKRLRPLLVLLSALTVDYNGTSHIKLAAIIEFIHTATLLHDDVVDTSELRRGRLTANAKWGNSPPVLVGDFLYSRAFQMLVSLGNMDIMGVLSDTTNTIAEGEVQQLLNAGNPDVSETEYIEVIYKKTAILFSAAMKSSAILANAKIDETENLERFGKHLGMAFQLQDDVLDYMGSSDELGKNIGDDLAEGKPTLPLIHAMKVGEPASRELIRAAIQNKDTTHIDKIVDIARESGGLEYTQKLAEREAELAKQALSHISPSKYRDTLAELASFSIQRNH